MRTERIALDDPRVREIAAAELRSRLRGVPDAVADPLVEAQLRSKLGSLAALFPDAAVVLASLGEEPAGYLVAASAEGGIRLCDIVVARAARGGGIGRAMLGELLARADAEQRPVTLSVWHDAPARAWYARHGFVVSGGDRQGHVEMRREYPGIHSVA